MGTCLPGASMRMRRPKRSARRLGLRRTTSRVTLSSRMISISCTRRMVSIIRRYIGASEGSRLCRVKLVCRWRVVRCEVTWCPPCLYLRSWSSFEYNTKSRLSFSDVFSPPEHPIRVSVVWFPPELKWIRHLSYEFNAQSGFSFWWSDAVRLGEQVFCDYYVYVPVQYSCSKGSGPRSTDEGLEAGDFQSCGIDVFFDYIVGVRCLLGH